jgi:pimeloyl-ACP methyl ester carboxylesterase
MSDAWGEPFAAGEAPALRGEATGEGPPVVLCHGLTATRRQVVHGSKALPKKGHLTVAYDARGHGESDPAPEGEGYGYPELVSDLERVIAAAAGSGPLVLAGHSMGSHTVVSYALQSPARVAGVVVIGPVYAGVISDEGLAYWDGMADALEEGGVEGFLGYLDRQGLEPEWRDAVLRFTRERMEAHRDLRAVTRAVREAPRSRPFEDMSELEFLDVPALVVASHDLADPGHPYAVAEAYAERLPRARLISEEEGESPLAWQGGKLSREIADFCGEEAVRERLAGEPEARPQ